MPQVAPADDPTAGIPPIGGAPGPAPGPAAGGLAALNPDEQAQLEALGRGELSLGPATPPPMKSAPVPAGVEKLPAVPGGVNQTYSFDDANRLAQYYGVLGMGENAKGWQTMADRIAGGEAPYSDGVWRPIPGGAKDPEVIARGARAQSGGAQAGTAPYDFVEVQRQGANGQIETWRLPKDQAMQLFGGGVPPGAGPPAAGPGTPAGAGGPPAAGPAGPPPAPGVGAPVGMPQAQPGMADVNKRLQDLQTNADQAQQEFNTVSNMRDIFSRGLQTGWGADTRAELGRILTQLGTDPDKIKSLTGINPADADAFQKQALRLSTEGVRTLGAREPGSIVQMFTRAYPSLETQPGALDLMTNILGQEQRRIFDKRNFMIDSLSSAPPGGYGPLGMQGAQLQAERNFDQQSPALNYLRSAYMMSGTDPNNKSDWYKQGWTPEMSSGNALTPAGQSVLKLIPPGASFYDATGTVQRRR